MAIKEDCAFLKLSDKNERKTCIALEELLCKKKIAHFTKILKRQKQALKNTVLGEKSDD